VKWKAPFETSFPGRTPQGRGENRRTSSLTLGRLAVQLFEDQLHAAGDGLGHLGGAFLAEGVHLFGLDGEDDDLPGQGHVEHSSMWWIRPLALIHPS